MGTGLEKAFFCGQGYFPVTSIAFYGDNSNVSPANQKTVSFSIFCYLSKFIQTFINENDAEMVSERKRARGSRSPSGGVSAITSCRMGGEI